MHPFYGRVFDRKLPIALCVWFIFGRAAAGGINTGSIPAWVTPVKPDITTPVPAYEAEYGVYSLIYDYQINEASKQYYMHAAIKIVNENGVETASQIKLFYDKAFEELVVHYIDVMRDGKIMHRLDVSKFKTIQQAKEMDVLQYDERMTALYFVEDVRPGDIIEYAYTITRHNPLFAKKCSQDFDFQFPIPMRHIFCRMLIPENRIVRLKYFNGAPDATQKLIGNNREYTWNLNDVKAIKMDDLLPDGYFPQPHAMVSEYSTWNEVKDWGNEIYRPVMVSGEQVKSKAAEIAAHYANDTDRIIATLRFVQDRIRYLGIETGLNTHKPHLPEQVLKQGYGDCKDKAVLFCCLLREMNIKAYPVLVKSPASDIMPEYLPSPLRFNHVCAAVVYRGLYYYFDPTLSLQRGTFSNNYFPHYKYGLLITDSINTLIKLPFNPYSTGTTMVEEFDLHDTITPSLLTTTIAFYGGDADRFREELGSMSLSQVQKSYTAFYTTLFKDIEPDGEVKIVADDSLADKIKVQQRFTIPNIWNNNAETGRLKVKFSALGITEQLSKPKNRNRTMPIGILYPRNFTEVMQIKYELHEAFPDDSLFVINDALNFSFRSHYRESTHILSLKYNLVTKAGSVPLADSRKYFKDLDMITNNLGYGINLPGSGFSGHKLPFSIFMLLVLIISAGITAFVCMRLYRNYDITTPYTGQEAEPVGGWLILIGISIGLSLLLVVYVALKNSMLSSVYDEILFTKNYGGNNKGLALGVAFELFFAGVRMVLLVFLAILFVQRRSIFPRIFIAMVILSFGVFAADELLLYMLPAKAETIQTGWVTLFRSFVFGAIWIPYMLLSERVKKTFILWHPSRKLEVLPVENSTSAEVTDDHQRFMPPTA